MATVEAAAPPAPPQETRTPDPDHHNSASDCWSSPVSMRLARFESDLIDPHILRGLD